jgi:hypothetical protein
MDESAYFEHTNVVMPKLRWSEKHNKWQLSLNSPDTGGYDCINLVLYFDTKEDAIKAMTE